MAGNFFSKKIILIAVSVVISFIIVAALAWYFFFSGYSLSSNEKLIAKITEIKAPGNSVVGSDKIFPAQLNVYFSQPAAAIDKLNMKLEKGIAIQPSIRGEWVWDNDTRLHFMPETDWIPNTEYKVRLEDEIFNPQVDVKDTTFSFASPAFVGEVINQEFYEDPQTIKNKSVIASFRFNYPLNIQNIEDKISVRTVSGDKYDFTYRLSDMDTKLHVISSPLKIKKDEDFAKIAVAGVENAYNKKPFSNKLTATVKIPSSSTFFKVKSLYSSIVRNELDNNNPEQILFVNFTTAVKVSDLDQNFSLNYSKENCYQTEKHLSAAKNNLTAIEDLQKLEVKEVLGNEQNLKTHLFKYDLNEQEGCLIVKINKELNSVEGFNLGKDIIKTVSLAPYPLEAKMAFDGSILSLRGSREVAFLSRGVKKLQTTVARIDTNDLNHLVTQTAGDFSHPYFKNYNFTEDNVSEIFEKNLTINMEHPAKANYSSLDLSEYFKDKKGLFIVKVRGYADNNHFSSQDSRLIMITDLGIVVKDNLDKTHDIFISNISKSRPVSGAKIEVLGKNGIPVLSAQTNSRGKAVIPDFSGFKRDKEAVVYKVSDDNDVSFLPINKSDRWLNFSRFEVGGEYDLGQDEYALKGYIFSDRGIYRPGEEGHFGLIVRQNDLNVPQKLPFVVEVRNPNGDIVATKNISADSVGFMEYELKLKPTAVTGFYSISLYVKDKDNSRYVAGTNFKVEEFQPDNLRIKADWEKVTEKGWLTDKEITALVSLYNLYGNPAVEHELKAKYSLSPTDFHFKKYASYLFRDPLRNADKPLRTYSDELPTEKTNADGTGKFELDLSQFEQGTYHLQMAIEGFELGSGRGVSTSLGALISPNEYLIGWKADGDLDYINKNSSRQVEFIAINHNLEQIGQHGLFLSLARRQYISSLIEMPNGTYRYQMVPEEQIILKQPWQIDSLGSSEKLKTDAPGEYILTIEDKIGRLLARLEYNVAGAANLSHAVDKDASLGLKLNQSEYNHGDEIKMQITAPYKGYGLITIERDNVYAYQWFKADTTSVAESIKLPDTVEGNAYLNVAFFRDINSKEIYMPSLSYATVPFSINKSKRKLEIGLDVPETVKPGDELIVKYKTSENANIVVYGVNQGILQVAGYRLPNPLSEFMKKKALRVITSQIMDLIMPDIRILRMLTSSGGDDDYAEDVLNQNLNPFARKVDKPVAFWSGILNSNEEGGSYVYKVPETFNGEIKVMVVAVSKDRFGSTEASVLSRGDFALIPSGPFNVSPGDEFVIGLSVGNLVENSGNDYPVRTSLISGDGFEVVGDKSQIVKLSEKGEAMLQFRLKALQKLGAKELIFTAESLKDSSKNARMPYPISLRPSNPYHSKFAMGYERSKYKLSEVENLYPEFRVQQLSASASPLVLATGLLKYLDKFPHSCTEQTISKVFPAMEVFFKSPELVKNLDIYTLFNDAMSKLRERQTLNGGFSAWSAYGSSDNAYDSVYATHFLVKAKEYNFNVSENMLNKALAYCEGQAALKPEGLDDHIPAYAIYVLTLSGKITTNYLLNLEEYYKNNFAKSWKKSLNASFMAASYQLLQDQTKARALIGQYENGASGDFDDDAANIYLMASYFPDDFKSVSRKSVEALLKPLNDGIFNTKSAAFAVLALNAFNHEENDKEIKFSSLVPDYIPFASVVFGPNTKDLSITSKQPFYYVVAQQGFVKEDKIAAVAEGLEVSKTYFDKDGNKVTKAKLGDELTVKIAYRGLRNEEINDVAIVDMLPGCVDAISNSLEIDGYADSYEIREDRVNVYVTAQREVGEIRYKVKVIAEGDFVVPPVYGSALYLPLVRANSASGTIKASE